ncbi:DUF5707 domain-containing protein [Streptomyces sp. NBC_01725]|uniref:DUF5707 domain-containing protein n=1 Tax=Streptomyces sp. NBC_01725 TaxID=2975923 RepID=UPI002E2D9304|nr:DUF5707 domain-containing protein [Streptomyces sp. NBC_01725]
MSRRTVLLSVTAAVAALGGAGAFALAYAGEQPPTLEESKARYTAPDGDRDGALVFTTEATASSGVKDVRVLAWPADSPFAGKELTAKDMATAEPAVCEPSGEDTARCTYTVAVTAADAAESPRGLWHVAVLARAGDGSTTLHPKATRFNVG